MKIRLFFTESSRVFDIEPVALLFAVGCLLCSIGGALVEKLELYIPKLEELWFRQRLLADEETMSYNKNWNVNYNGYHRETGCVDFPEKEWAEWYERYIGNEPDRFYAYIKRASDGVWIGDVNFHDTPEKDWWDMGIVIYAPYRGKGYAVPALKLMLDHAFRVCGISRIHNDFEVARHEISAWEAHRKAGFRELGVVDGFLQMMIGKEEYLGKTADISDPCR